MVVVNFADFLHAILLAHVQGLVGASTSDCWPLRQTVSARLPSAELEHC